MGEVQAGLQLPVGGLYLADEVVVIPGRASAEEGRGVSVLEAVAQELGYAVHLA